MEKETEILERLDARIEQASRAGRFTREEIRAQINRSKRLHTTTKAEKPAPDHYSVTNAAKALEFLRV
jgi:hypothetical protein